MHKGYVSLIWLQHRCALEIQVKHGPVSQKPRANDKYSASSTIPSVKGCIAYLRPAHLFRLMSTVDKENADIVLDQLWYIDLAKSDGCYELDPVSEGLREAIESKFEDLLS